MTNVVSQSPDSMTTKPMAPPILRRAKRGSMLRMNKKMEYGMMALLYLDTKSDKTASVREIAELHSIPEQLLSKVMQSLKTNQMVSAVYGNQGGYHLNRNLGEITLLELSQTVVGPVQVAACLDGKQDCPAHSGCTIVSPMMHLNQMVVRLFQQTTLASLIQQGALS